MSFEGTNIQKMKQEAVPEKVIAAAVMYGDEIFTAPIHAMAIEEMQMKHPEAQHEGQYKNGFLTSAQRFVSRDEAVAIADANDQIKEGKLEKAEHRGLRSEDLKTETLSIEPKDDSEGPVLHS